MKGIAAGVLFCLLLAAPTLEAQSLPTDSTIRAMLKARVDSGRAKGIVVGILENGRRRYVSYGTAGPGRSELNEHTLFEIGSISKTFTGLLLADAVQRGEVRLDQPVVELLPPGTKVPSRDDKQITLALLSTHRSGLPRLPGNLSPANRDDPYVDYNVDRLYQFLAGYQLPRAPGELAEYSNLGVGLLGHALTRRAGANSWGALVKQRITDPLGMRETWVDVPANTRGRISAGYNATLDTVPAWHIDALAGAGALRSTASDMLIYLGAELDTVRGPLARAVALGRTPRADFAPNTRIGLGWIVSNAAAHPIWEHDGGTAGFRTYAAFDPARNVGVVVLGNSDVSVNSIGAHLLNPAAPYQVLPAPRTRVAITLSADALERLVGEYPLTPQFVLRITRQGDSLFLQATGQPKLQLVPTSPERFFLREVEAEVVFDLGATGKATGLTLLQGGAAPHATRTP